MGGQGSGRKPDPFKKVIEKKTPIAKTPVDNIIIPNYSGVANHEPTLNVFDKRYGKIDDGITAGQLLFWDGSKWTYTETTELFWDDTNKNFGIGTATPLNELHVEDASSPVIQIRDSTTPMDLYLQAGNAGGNIGTFTNHPLSLLTNWTEAIHIDTSQKVGIGTATPSHNLHIKTSGTVVCKAETTTTDGAAYISMKNDAVEWRSGVVGSVGDDYIIYDVTNSKFPLKIEPATPTNTLYLDSSGNVGIGTTAPPAKLTVGDGGGVAAWFDGEEGILIDPETTVGRVAVVGTGQADIILYDEGAGSDVKGSQIRNDGGVTSIYTINDAFNASSQRLSINHTTGAVDVVGAFTAGTIASDGNTTIGGATILTGTTTLTSSTDSFDATGISLVYVNTTGGQVNLGGLTNGTAGQKIHFIRISGSNTFRVEHNEGGGDEDIYCYSSNDRDVALYGGITLIFDGTVWYTMIP